jgi:hypothetical protein
VPDISRRINLSNNFKAISRIFAEIVSTSIVENPKKRGREILNPTGLLALLLEALKGEVVLANMFQDLPIGVQLEADVRGPGLRIAFGIVKCEVDL